MKTNVKKEDVLEIVYPGKILKEYFMEPLGITGYRLAKELSVPQITISNIVNNKRGLSTDMSLRLSKYFGNTAEFWLNLQQHYELEKEKERVKDILAKIIPFHAGKLSVQANGKRRERITAN